MAATNASLELLAHFDGPVKRETALPAPPRGVGWVLQWTAASATLVFASVMLAQFAYCLAAERTLARAARAGALEATLPRATYQSVAEAVERRLADKLPSRWRFRLHQNGVPVRGLIRADENGPSVVMLEVTTREILPRWLRTVTFWLGNSQISVQAERQMPGRRLAGR
jgi:hypothetical protein